MLFIFSPFLASASPSSFTCSVAQKTTFMFWRKRWLSDAPSSKKQENVDVTCQWFVVRITPVQVDKDVVRCFRGIRSSSCPAIKYFMLMFSAAVRFGCFKLTICQLWRSQTPTNLCKTWPIYFWLHYIILWPMTLEHDPPLPLTIASNLANEPTRSSTFGRSFWQWFNPEVS